jgi:hypothetical protein
MGASQSAVARLCFCAFLLGGICGLCYDFLRISRILLGAQYRVSSENRFRNVNLPLIGNRPRRKRKRLLGAVIFIEDFFFCLFSGIAMILLFYEVTNGEIRYVAFLFTTIGFVVYRFTLGKPMMLLSETLAFFLESLLRYALWLVLLPIRSGIVFLKRVWYAHRKKKMKKERRIYTQKIIKSIENAAEEQGKRKERRGVEKQKEAVQPEPSREGVSGNYDCGVARGIRE